MSSSAATAALVPGMLVVAIACSIAGRRRGGSLDNPGRHV
jgi:hypothetical protein